MLDFKFSSTKFFGAIKKGSEFDEDIA